MNKLLNINIIRKVYFAFLYHICGEKICKKYASKWTDDCNEKYGAETLDIVREAASESNTNWWLSWGSILAYYREHGFIKGDNDIDIGMFGKDISVEFVDRLIVKGFKFSCAIVDKNFKAFHLTFDYKHVKLDLYSYYIDGENIIGFAPRSIKGSWALSFKKNRFGEKWGTFPYKGFKEVEFVGVKTKVFENDKDILQMMYGEDFMTPIPGKKSGPSKYITIIEASEDNYAYPCDYNGFVELKKNHLI